MIHPELLFGVGEWSTFVSFGMSVCCCIYQKHTCINLDTNFVCVCVCLGVCVHVEWNAQTRNESE